MSQLFLFIIFIFISSSFGQTGKYEGFGSVTKGGEGGDVYHVTSLKDDGRIPKVSRLDALIILRP